MKRAMVQAIGALIGVFLLGAVVGGAATHAVLVREEATAFGPRRQAPPLRALVRRLDLTTEQSRQVAAVFERHREAMDAKRLGMLEQCGQGLRQEIDAVDAEIGALLTPEQQRKFATLREERDRMGLVGPPGPMGHGPRGGRGRR